MPRNLIIFGSPNCNSFTAHLLSQETADLTGETATYNCFEDMPAPCDGCGLCKKQDGCKFSDLDTFFNDFERTDNVIIAFPIYNGSFPAPLKALLDRFQRFFNKRFALGVKPPMKGKRDVTLIITAGCDTDPLPLILPQIKPLFTISGCSLKKAVLLLDTDNISPNQGFNPKIINLSFILSP